MKRTSYRRSWLEALNWFVFRWMFFRLARVIDTDTRQQIGWRIFFPMWPSTGWFKVKSWDLEEFSLCPIPVDITTVYKTEESDK